MMLDDAITANGAPPAAVEPPVAPPAPVVPLRPVGPRIQRAEEWLDFPAPYTGFRIRAWTDYPKRLFDGVTTEDQIEVVLQQVLLEHNGWQDDEGELPQPTDPAFYARVGTNLLTTTVAVVRQAATTPPNLPPLTRRR